MHTHAEIAQFLLATAVLLAAARVCGEIAQRFRQPAVLGEILAGILLGPTVFGALAPAAYHWLLPSDGFLGDAMQGIRALSITLFLMVAGMEIDLSALWRRGVAAAIVGLAGTAVPFAIGLAAGWLFPAAVGASAGAARFAFALFIATALAISALPVIARILIDLKLLRSDLGVVIVAAAMFSDLVGWMVFAVVLALMHGTDSERVGPGFTALSTLGFAAFMLSLGRWLLNRALAWVQAHASWPGGVLAFAVSLALLAAALTEWLGAHAAFGAFLMGVALGDSAHLHQRTRRGIEQFVSFIFAPLFFVGIGLRSDFVQHFDPGLVGLVLTLAIVSKFAGCTLSAWWAGFSRAEATAIGFGMNARGAMEIILGLLALQAGIIDERLFVALVIMALITSMLAGPGIQWSLGRRSARRFEQFLHPQAFVAELDHAALPAAMERLIHMSAAVAGVPPAAIAAALAEREWLVEAETAHGVVIPHACVPGLRNPLIAVGLSAAGVDGGEDRPRVHALLLVLAPAEEDSALLLLHADVARALQRPEIARRMAACVGSFIELRAFLNSEGRAEE